MGKTPLHVMDFSSLSVRTPRGPADDDPATKAQRKLAYIIYIYT
jgi:hypothetical protein